MATRIQFRRGTTAQHASFTGAVGEMTVNTDKDCVVIHDGSTTGGFEMMRADGNNASAFSANNLTTGTVDNARFPSGTVINTARTLNRGLNTFSSNNGSVAAWSIWDCTLQKKQTNSWIRVELFSNAFAHWGAGNTNPVWKYGYKTGSQSSTESDYTFPLMGNAKGSDGAHGSDTKFGYADDNHTRCIRWFVDMGQFGSAGTTYYFRMFMTSENTSTMYSGRNPNNWHWNSGLINPSGQQGVTIWEIAP